VGSLEAMKTLFTAGSDVNCEGILKAQQGKNLDATCADFIRQAQRAHKLLADLEALIQAGDTAAAQTLFIKSENVKVRDTQGR
jgi:hypothetical protein